MEKREKCNFHLDFFIVVKHLVQYGRMRFHPVIKADFQDRQTDRNENAKLSDNE